MAKIRARSLILATMFATLLLSTADAAEFTVVNASGVALYNLYIAPCAGPHWGPNQLEGSQIPTSRRFTISNIQPGCYDVKLIVPYWNDCIIAGAALLRGNMIWTITPTQLTDAVLGGCAYTLHYVSAGRRPWAWYLPQ